MSRQHLSWRYLSMSGISQLLLPWFWRNFKGSFLGTSRTDTNYQVNICPGNICPSGICPYQEYLSCYWPNFDETFNVVSWEHLEQIPTIKLTFVQATCYWPDIDQTLTDANSYSDICQVNIWSGDICLYQEYQFWPKFKGRFQNFDPKFVVLNKILNPTFFWPKVFLNLNFWTWIFWTKIFWYLTFFNPHFFGYNSFRPKVLLPWIVLGSKLFWQKQQQQ